MTASAMPGAISEIVVHTRLEDGRKVCLRAVRPSDEARMRRGIERLSSQSRYLRFFSGAPVPPDRVITQLVAVDGHRHLAWGAILSDDAAHPAIGAVHAVRDNPGSSSAEFAVGILDDFHGLGLARMLTAVLLVHCHCEGIERMDVQILSENHAAASLYARSAARNVAARRVCRTMCSTPASRWGNCRTIPPRPGLRPCLRRSRIICDGCGRVAPR